MRKSLLLLFLIVLVTELLHSRCHNQTMHLSQQNELHLQEITRRMTSISLFVLILIGSFGSLCNVIIFTSKRLKNNSCAFYFLCSSIVEIFLLCFGGISRLATEHFGSRLINHNLFFCKIRAFLNTSLSTVSTYFLLWAVIDRCILSSNHRRYRNLSQIRTAHRISSITIVVILGSNIHNLIFFGHYPTCLPRPGLYSFIYSLYLILLTSLLPDALICLLTLRTLRNVRQTHFRLVQNSILHVSQKRRLQRMEVHLFLMMIAQATVTILLDLTRVSCYTYYFLTNHLSKSSSEETVAIFIFHLSNVLFYVNVAKSFYVYTLASSFFRQVFIDAFRQYVHQWIILPSYAIDETRLHQNRS